MPLRKRSGKWHYRFWVNGHEFTGATDLDATERNKTSAMRTEAEARRLVLLAAVFRTVEYVVHCKVQARLDRAKQQAKKGASDGLAD